MTEKLKATRFYSEEVYSRLEQENANLTAERDAAINIKEHEKQILIKEIEAHTQTKLERDAALRELAAVEMPSARTRRELEGKLEAALAEVERMRLRLRCLLRNQFLEYESENGELRTRCMECFSSWLINAPEEHGLGCLAAKEGTS